MNLGNSVGAQMRDTVRERQSAGMWQEVGTTVIRHVREVVEEMNPVRHEIWITQDDERTCPSCGQLDGTIFEAGAGFAPPLHDHCRCQRHYHHTEFRRRTVEHWRDIVQTETTWAWRHA